jgi:hypothetical protein
MVLTPSYRQRLLTAGQSAWLVFRLEWNFRIGVLFQQALWRVAR